MKPWIIGAAVAAACAGVVGAGHHHSGGAQPTASAAPVAAAADGTLDLDDAAFLAGAWRGEMNGDLVEEHWTAPAGGNITGMFRWIGADGGARVIEVLTISREQDGAVVLRLRHFDGALTPWKSEAEPVALSLAEASPNKAVFRADAAKGGSLAAVTYEVKDGGTLAIVVEFPAERKREPLRFSLKRAAPAAG